MLPMIQRMFFNPLVTPENRAVQDLSRREMIILAPMLALMILIGVHPTPLLRRMEPSVRAVLVRVHGVKSENLGVTISESEQSFTVSLGSELLVNVDEVER